MGRPRKFDEDHVLDIAQQLFLSKGYENTSLADLMAGMGLQKGSIYKAFGSKRALFKICLLRYIKMYNMDMSAALQNEDDYMMALLHFIGQALFSAQKTGDHAGCLMVNTMVECAPHDTEFRDILLTANEELEAMLTKVIEAGQNSGSFRRDINAESLADQIMVFVSGMQVAARAGYDLTHTKQRCAIFLKVLLADKSK